MQAYPRGTPVSSPRESAKAPIVTPPAANRPRMSTNTQRLRRFTADQISIGRSGLLQTLGHTITTITEQAYAQLLDDTTRRELLHHLSCTTP